MSQDATAVCPCGARLEVRVTYSSDMHRALRDFQEAHVACVRPAGRGLRTSRPGGRHA